MESQIRELLLKVASLEKENLRKVFQCSLVLANKIG
jgi:hypothetical protein